MERRDLGPDRPLAGVELPSQLSPSPWPWLLSPAPNWRALTPWLLGLLAIVAVVVLLTVPR
jgi:hypothetical protein